MNKYEAEQWVIGGILNNPENFERAKRLLSKEDFQNPSHREIIRAMQKLDDGGIPLDLTTLYPHLKEKDIGLARYLMDDIPTDQVFDYWTMVVKRQGLKRKLRELVTGVDIDTGKVEAIVYQLNNLNKATPLYRDINEIPDRTEDPQSLIETGFKDVDKNLCFRTGRLMVVSGKTGEGKTSFGLQASYYMSKTRPVGVVSLEMTAEEVKERIKKSFGVLPDLKRFFIADPSALSSLELKHICKALKSEQGVEVIFLDYLQLMQEREDFRSRHLEVSYIIRQIKEFTKELKMAFIVVSTLNRGTENRIEPSLSDLKESGDIEYAADYVLFIHSPGKKDYETKEKIVKLFIIAKNRWGKAGDIKIFWDGAKTQFEDYNKTPIESYSPDFNMGDIFENDPPRFKGRS
jgi:replicative DNA helicase